MAESSCALFTGERHHARASLNLLADQKVEI